MNNGIGRRNFLIVAALTSVGAGIKFGLPNAVAAPTISSEISGLYPDVVKKSVALRTLNAQTGRQRSQSARTSPEIKLLPNERITYFANLPGYGKLVATEPTLRSKKSPQLPRLLIIPSGSVLPIRQKVQVITLPQRFLHHSIEGLATNRSNQLIALVKHHRPQGAALSLFALDLKRGKYEKLPFPAAKLANVTLIANSSSDGTVYAITANRKGGHHGATSSLDELNLEKKALQKIVDLNYKDMLWEGNFSSLVCTSLGKLYLLGATDEEPENSVYSVNIKTGKLKQISKFDSSHIALT